MICTENIHRITKYFLLIALILFHTCFAKDEIENNHTAIPTTLGRFGKWNIIPTIEPPNGIKDQNPYLYFASIIFVIILVATSIMLGLRSCYKASSYFTSEYPATVPVVSGFRRSLVPTEAVMINRRMREEYDKPPSYSSVVQGPSCSETNVLLKSETPPPNYSSIV